MTLRSGNRSPACRKQSRPSMPGIRKSKRATDKSSVKAATAARPSEPYVFGNHNPGRTRRACAMRRGRHPQSTPNHPRAPGRFRRARNCPGCWRVTSELRGWMSSSGYLNHRTVETRPRREPLVDTPIGGTGRTLQLNQSLRPVRFRSQHLIDPSRPMARSPAMKSTEVPETKNQPGVIGRAGVNSPTRAAISVAGCREANTINQPGTNGACRVTIGATCG